MEPYHGVVKLKNIEDLIVAVTHTPSGQTYLVKDGGLVLVRDTKDNI